jgi:type I restriction-modification system DNA methylase subunit
MASEELQQRYPDSKGQKIGNYEVFECQLVTLRQFAEHGILPDIDYGEFKAEKCDSLIISRVPDIHAVVIGEHKKPGELNDKNWKVIAKDMLLRKCRPTNAVIGYVTDSNRTYWINGQAEDIVEIQREDGHALPLQVNFKDGDFIDTLNYIIANFDPATNFVREKQKSNPDHLAREIWQTIWRLRADNPEDCLATFVELFIFKFLDDLRLLKKDKNGADVSLNYVMDLDRDKSYAYYFQHIRPYVKELFPVGKDGYSIINGIVLQPTNRDHNIIFHEIMRKFIKFGSLKNTESDFKRRLYESFLKQSKTTSNFGQFLTPRRIVSAIYDMADVASLTSGKSICDPASGVGGFVLEEMARDLASQWELKAGQMKPVHKWFAWEVMAKTSILAKANALVHCGDFLAEKPNRIKSFAKWLNEVFHCWDRTGLGSLETMEKDKFDLILTNPPFVVSGSKDYGKIIKANNKRATYYSQKASGVESLFIQFVVKSLKPNGEAWILLPETFFLRTTDKNLRSWLFKNCFVDFFAILPERTFYNTPKRVVVCHFRKRQRILRDAEVVKFLSKEKTLIFAISEIGETRDAKRLPCESDLPEMVKAYKTHKAGLPLEQSKRAISVSSERLYETKSLNLRHFWDKKDAIELDLLGSEEDPVESKLQLEKKIEAIKSVVDDWKDNVAPKQSPKRPEKWRTVRLGDENLFSLSIGRRVLKKEIYKLKTNIPLYSANIRKPFGFVHVANAGNLPHGGALWSIDSDFDCRGISSGEVYSITDHCGQIELLVPDIDPSYLASQIRQAGLDQGFNREYRPSLKVIADLEIDLPVTEIGEFDLEIMQKWSGFSEEIERTKEDIEKLLKQ